MTTLTRKKAPCIDMRTDMLKDERVAALADFAGLANVYEAVGRLFALWSWCADRGLRDAPEDCEGYAVSEAIVRRFFGPRGVDAILAEGCDELALGARHRDGLIYLRGTSERVAAIRKLAAMATAGGKARSSAPRSAGGAFVRATTVVQPDTQPATSHAPPREPAGDQLQPAFFLLPSSSGDLDLPESHSLDQASPFSPEPDSGAIVRAEREEVAPVAEPPGDMPLEMSRGWQPEPEPDLDEEARDLEVDVEHELHELRRRNEKHLDWQARWRKWLQHAINFARKNRNSRRPAQPAPCAATSAQIAARARAEAERERAQIAENARKAAADREESARIAAEALERLRDPKKAAG